MPSPRSTWRVLPRNRGITHRQLGKRVRIWFHGIAVMHAFVKRVSLLVFTLALVAPTTGCREDRPDERVQRQSQTSEPPEQTDEPEVRLPEGVVRGVCLAHVWESGGEHGYGTEANRAALAHLDRLGADAVSLTPFGWMASVSATEVRGEHNSELPDGGENRSALVAAIDQARTRELSVLLKPHIWIRGGAWRGAIEPTDDGEPAWEAWWRSYRNFMLHYARIAAEHDVEVLVAGVELGSALAARPEAFLALVDDIREIYDGRVTYAANWDADLPDEIWRALDSVGVQFYPPLTEEDDPDVETLRAALVAHVTDWNERARQLGRPLAILETGYKSAASAVDKPWGWPQNLPADARQVDRDLQRRAYTALFAELRRASELESVYIWKYFTHPDHDEGGTLGFSPRGKPAESVLERAYRR